MSFESKQNYETDLNIQNTRIMKHANEGEKAIDNKKFLTKVDQELIREYKSQFEKGFEYIDETTGEKKFRKYQIPQDEPELEEPILKKELNEDEIKYEISLLEPKLRVLYDILEKTQYEIDDINILLNLGSINPETAKEELIDLYRRLNDIKLRIELESNNLDELVDLFNVNEDIKNENEHNINTTKQKNKEKIDMYKNELNFLNQNAFSTEQQPNETEEDYYNRLTNNAQMETTEETLNNATKLTLLKFKEHLKEIIRNETKIEQVCNSIDNLGTVENKLYLLKKWALFKKNFTKIYGINNTYITPIEIVDFMKEFIMNDGKTEEKIITKNRLDTEVKDNTLIIYSGQDYDLYLKWGIFGGRKFILYSFTGTKNTFEEIPNESESFKKVAFSHIYEYTHITERDIYKILKTHYKDGLDILAEKLHIYYGLEPETLGGDGGLITLDKTYTRTGKKGKEDKIHFLGYGLEKIPEYSKLGKLLLNTHKVYYKNILSIKHHNNLSIAGFKNIKVSEKFVKIIMNLLKNIHPTINDINSLSIQEKQLYDRIIYLASLNKEIPHTNDKTINNLKNKLELIEGEIEAGNNNPSLISELYIIIHSLKDFGILSPKDIKEYMKQF